MGREVGGAYVNLGLIHVDVSQRPSQYCEVIILHFKIIIIEKNTGEICHFLLQGTLPTQGSNLLLPLWQADSLQLNHQGSKGSVIRNAGRQSTFVASDVAFTSDIEEEINDNMNIHTSFHLH